VAGTGTDASGQAGSVGGSPRQAPGWFPDPLGRWPMRWWTGDSWGAWVWSGEHLGVDLVHGRRVGPDDVAHLDFVAEVLLPELQARDLLDDARAGRARAVVDELRQEALWAPEHVSEGTAAGRYPAVPFPVQAVPSGAGAPPLSGWAVPGARRDDTPGLGRTAAAGGPGKPPTAAAAGAPPAERATRPVGALGGWWDRAGESLRSDLVLHGVAYLGVLLFFVAAFGLVAFAFGDVRRELRPVAELVIALAPFGAAWLLRRRGALVVASALELVGGLLVPLMATTSLLDGLGVPPDLDGGALVVAATAIWAAAGLAWALWSARHPGSALRYLVAPMAWMAVAMATMGLGRAIPTGEGVAAPAAAQVAAALGALVATVAWARLRPAARLAGPTLAAAVPGLAVLGLLAVLTWAGTPAPGAWSVGVAAVLGVAGLELLAVRLPAPVVGLAMPLWWAAACAALLPAAGAATASAVGALGMLLVLELGLRAGRPPWALALAALGFVGLALAVADAAHVAVLAAAAAWAAVRRRGAWARDPRIGLDAAAAVLPVVALRMLADLVPAGTALLVASVLVLVVAMRPVRAALSRAADDPFWQTWWWAALGVASVVALVLVASAGVAARGWAVPTAAVVLAAAAATGPLPPPARAWLMVGLAGCAWVGGCQAVGLTGSLRDVVLAAGGLAVVLAAHVRPGGPGVGHLGLAGHVLGLAAVALITSEWPAVTCLALATAGWAVTAGAAQWGRSPVTAVLVAAASPLRYLPPVLVALGLPLTAVAALDALGALGVADPWSAWTLATIAVGYALVGRLAPAGPLCRTAVWAGLVAAAFAVAAAPDQAVMAVGLASVLVVALLLPPSRRPRLHVWVAWLAVAPFALTSLDALWPVAPAGEASRASAVLALCGALLMLVAAVLDRRRPAAGEVRAPRSHPAVLPATIGAVEALLGAVLLLAVAERPLAGWALLAQAAVVLLVGVLGAVGALGGVAVVLAWCAAVLLSGPAGPVAWVGAAVAAGLLVGAEVAHRALPGRGPLARWDLPLAGAAGVVAATALVGIDGSVQASVVPVLIGAETLAVAARVRRATLPAALLAGVGTVLVLLGAAQAGPGWLALALAVLAATLVALAALATGPARVALQLGAAVATWAAWGSGLLAIPWSAQQRLDLTAVAGGVLALAAAAAARARRVDRSWPALVGVVGVGAALACAAVGTTARQDLVASPAAGWAAASAAVVAGLAMSACALLVAASPLRLAFLRDLGVVLGTLAVLEAGLVWTTAPAASVLGLCLVALACALAVLATASRPTAWLRPLVEAIVLATGLAVVVALGPQGSSELVVVVLGTSAAAAASVGSGLGMVGIQALAPVLACAAWLEFARGTVAGQPQWVAMAVGLALLMVVGLWRHDRGRSGGNRASAEVVGVELVGLGLLVGPSLVSMVSDSLGWSLLALGLGLGVAAWGVLTRVRRRLLAGVGTVLVAMALLVLVPLVQLIPSWGGAGLWLAIGAVGVTAVLVATLLEEGRAAAGRALARLEQATAGWE